MKIRDACYLGIGVLEYLLWLERDLPTLAFDPSWLRVMVQDVIRGPCLIPAQLIRDAAHVALHRVWRVMGGWSWRTLAEAPPDLLAGWDAVRAAGLLWQVIQVAAVRLSSDEVHSLLRAAEWWETEWWELVMALDEEADPYAALGLSEVRGGAAVSKMLMVAWYSGELVCPVL